MADVAMPQEMITWMRDRNWGDHHLEWHVVRRWDLIPDGLRTWAIGQGWSKSPIQEGEPGNGLNFLAMHRVMFRILNAQFPQHAGSLEGWLTPPTDPNDLDDPLPGGQQDSFDADRLSAINRLTSDFDSFASDDEFGLYLETSLRPVPGNPGNISSDPSTGIHNYLHNRWSDPSSTINLGDPEVNLENKRFWKLHGWIETVWTNFRTHKGFTETDPEYVAAIEAGEQHMGGLHADAFHADAAFEVGNAPTPPLEITSELTAEISNSFFDNLV